MHHAYDTLIDEDERRWYDRHRSAILGGSGRNATDADHDGEKEEYGVNLYPFFSPSCFSGFDDSSSDGGDFFSVYSAVFESLAQQEHEAWMQRQEDGAFEGGKRDGYEHYPPFGSSTSLWQTSTKVFYSRWESFTTMEEFAWSDAFSPEDMRRYARPIRRRMEEENKRARKKEKQAYVDLVRRLVVFVKKKDPRVRRRKEEMEVAESRRLREEKERRELEKQMRRQRRLERANNKEDADDDIDEEVEKLLDFEFDHGCSLSARKDDDDDEEEDEELDDGARCVDAKTKKKERKKQSDDNGAGGGEAETGGGEFYCIVCKKRFKSSKQWQNHEKSKRHIELVARLQQSLREEEEMVDAASSLNREADTSTAAGVKKSRDSQDTSVEGSNREECNEDMEDGEVEEDNGNDSKNADSSIEGSVKDAGDEAEIDTEDGRKSGGATDAGGVEDAEEAEVPAAKVRKARRRKKTKEEKAKARAQVKPAAALVGSSEGRQRQKKKKKKKGRGRGGDDSDDDDDDDITDVMMMSASSRRKAASRMSS